MAVRYPPVTITHTVARGGQSPGDVLWPHSVSTNHTRRHIIITDRGNQRVNTYSSEYPHRPIRSWGREGHREGEFGYPHSVTCDHQGRVIVCDWGNHRVQIFTDTGHYVTQIRCRSEEGEEIQPVFVEVDEEDNIYVRGDVGDMIHVYDRVGVPVRRLTVRGSWGAFTIHEDTLYTCDDEAWQIYVYTLPHGSHVTSISLEGVIRHMMCAITVSRDGRLIVTDYKYDDCDHDNNKSLIHVLSTVSDSGEVSGASQTFTYNGQALGVSILWENTLVVTDCENDLVHTGEHRDITAAHLRASLESHYVKLQRESVVENRVIPVNIVVLLPGVSPPLLPMRGDELYQVRPLKYLCQSAIRTLLGAERLNNIDEHPTLCLPKKLKKYLKFE